MKEELWTPKRGDRVLVREYGAEEWSEAIYLATIEGVDSPYIAVFDEDEGKFISGEKFSYKIWNQMKAIPQIEVTKEEAEQKYKAMKTPMQEAIDKVQSLKEIDAVINPIDVITSILEQMLEKEKEVIIKTYNHAALHGMLVELGKEKTVGGKQYYNETFNTEEK